MALEYREIEAKFLCRYMAVKQMKYCLRSLQDSDILYPNKVGNLSVVRYPTKEYIGYIDFAEEVIWLK